MNVERTRLYRTLIAICRVIYAVVFGAKASGREHFPKDQNCILIGNHIHAIDPVTLAVFYKANEIHFIAKESIFENRWLARILTKLHAFPVNRGETDMRAMRQAVQVLRDGHVLGIYPEGHRQKDRTVKAIETGVAVIALRSGVPVVPVYVSGHYRPFGRLRLTVGPPIPLDDIRSGRADTEALETVKRRVVESLNALAPCPKAVPNPETSPNGGSDQ